jgi:hypothetical protein
MEGILLEKVQDRIEKELTEKGEIYGWDIMNEAKILEERKKEELELNIELLKVSDPHEALNKENETKNKWESEDEQNKKKKKKLHFYGNNSGVNYGYLKFQLIMMKILKIKEI